MDELAGYSAEVQQAFSLNNASETEITKARFRQVKDIFGQHSLDVGNQAIQACMHCEKTISLLNHLRIHHKDVSALIKLQRNLAERRAALFYLKREQPMEYAHVLRVYGLTDL